MFKNRFLNCYSKKEDSSLSFSRSNFIFLDLTFMDEKEEREQTV
jgi:hypothetical protein